MGIEEWLVTMVEKKASDLFVTVGVPPTIKVNGLLETINGTILTAEDAQAVVLSMMTEDQKEKFQATKEMNFALYREKLGRFRVSAFMQRSFMGAVLRRIESKIPTLEELHMPKIFESFSMIQRGLVILVGGTGTGKSTTLAAMMGYRNQNSKGHIVTIEDPIEYVHEPIQSIITQREVGIDTDSFEIALKNTLRQAPDVILIGEIRTRETMGYAVAFSETGHLCLATLHANNANQALDRIINFFPQEMHHQVWLDLSLNIKAIAAQVLIPSTHKGAREPAVEILVNTPIVADCIRKGEVNEIKDIMTKSNEQGMQTFDQSLFKLYSEGKISYESALKYANSENELRLMIKLSKGLVGKGTQDFSIKEDSSYDEPS